MHATRLSPAPVLLCGAAIVGLGMAIRHRFGPWLQPAALERGWTRRTFAFALAVQSPARAWPIASALCARSSAAASSARSALC